MFQGLKYIFQGVEYLFQGLKHRTLKKRIKNSIKYKKIKIAIMANYVVKEMPDGMNSSNGKAFPKMQVYTEFDYDKVVELVNTYSPAFSKGTIRGVLDTLTVVMKNVLPMGHTLKIDNLGVFSLALEFSDSTAETADAETEKTKYHHVKAKGINLRVDQKLVDEINRENTFERSGHLSASPSPFTREQRLQRALAFIDKHGTIRLQEYANLNALSRTRASKELAQFVSDPSSGIKASGSGPLKCWVRN